MIHRLPLQDADTACPVRLIDARQQRLALASLRQRAVGGRADTAWAPMVTR
jgi:hypothetical protein